MPDEHAAAFCEGLAGILNRWTALQLAVLNEWGGAESAQKATAMLEELEHWFLRRRAGKYAEDLEELLVEILGDDFCVQCEDGSPREVAKIACEMYEQVAEGNYALAWDVCAKPLPREHLERCQREEADRRWTAGAAAAPPAAPRGGAESGSDGAAMGGADMAAGLDGVSMKHDPDVDEMTTGGRRGQPEPDEDGWCTVPKRGGR